MTDNPVPEPAPKRARSSQDQSIANKINTYRTALVAAQANAEMIALLQPRGYDAAAIAEGLDSCNAAQAAFTARQEAHGAQKQAVAALRTTERAARKGLDDLRKIARVVFKTNDAAKATLDLSSRVPSDREKFLTAADAVYTAILDRSSYLAALGKRGYDQAVIEAEQARLPELIQASAAHEKAQSAAKRATTERNAAVKALDDWWAEFRTVAQVVLRDRPDLLGELGL